jgi:hypothetical protein
MNSGAALRQSCVDCSINSGLQQLAGIVRLFWSYQSLGELMPQHMSFLCTLFQATMSSELRRFIDVCNDLLMASSRSALNATAANPTAISMMKMMRRQTAN